LPPELGRRRRTEDAVELIKITSSKMIFEIMQPIIGELAHEEFWIVYLNNPQDNFKSQLSKGVLQEHSMCGWYLRMHSKWVTGLILCHNHPSGTLVPSEADKQITKKTKNRR
jgi:DNA repair protein RadC